MFIKAENSIRFKFKDFNLKIAKIIFKSKVLEEFFRCDTLAVNRTYPQDLMSKEFSIMSSQNKSSL